MAHWFPDHRCIPRQHLSEFESWLSHLRVLVPILRFCPSLSKFSTPLSHLIAHSTSHRVDILTDSRALSPSLPRSPDLPRWSRHAQPKLGPESNALALGAGGGTLDDLAFLFGSSKGVSASSSGSVLQPNLVVSATLENGVEGGPLDFDLDLERERSGQGGAKGWLGGERDCGARVKMEVDGFGMGIGL